MTNARNISKLSVGGDNGALKIPSGTTAQRPSNPQNGYTRHNTTLGSLEFYDATSGVWIATNLIPVVNSVTGGVYAGDTSTLGLSLSNATDKIDVVFTKAGTVLATVTNVAVSAGSASGILVPSAVYSAVAVGDTVAISIKNQDGTPSSNSQSKTVIGLPTGGTITSSGGYRVHTFTSSGNLVVPANFSKTANYLIVAGGGGGGNYNSGGGGGAGGLLSGTVAISQGTYSAAVGAGGSGANTNGGPDSLAGSTSSFTGLTSAIGGGRGGANSGVTSGGNGGSGGGGAIGSNGGSGTSGQGYSGGNALYNGGNYPGGGGGGAGGAGQATPSASVAGNGGPGVISSITGSPVTYAGGGGGSTQSGGTGGAGGTGGGGAGSPANGSVSGSAGGANTGGGGGAGGYYSLTSGLGANGGSGVVIIGYTL